MALGDFFSEKERRSFFRGQFHAGRILQLNCTFTNPPKLKYVLLCCVSPKPHVLVINSVINQFKQQRPHLLSLQIPILRAAHDFLPHDSYVDCSALFVFEEPEIERQILNDITKLKGTIEPTTKDAVLSAVLGAKTLSPAQKALIQCELLAQDP
jgi:hypothetical protein